MNGASTPADIPASASVRTVTMPDDLTFAPAELHVKVGDTVTWANTSRMDHTVTADPTRAKRAGNVELPPGAKPFDSGNRAPGATFSHTFEVAGRYRYFCVPHEIQGMIGTVIVE